MVLLDDGMCLVMLDGPPCPARAIYTRLQSTRMTPRMSSRTRHFQSRLPILVCCCMEVSSVMPSISMVKRTLLCPLPNPPWNLPCRAINLHCNLRIPLHSPHRLHPLA